MGFPLSRFQQLADLCSSSDKAYNTFREFKLVGVVVHSPDDERFVRRMKHEFEYLHERTGNDFAFITFLDPPEEWAFRHRSWMNEQQSLFYGENCEDEDFVRLLRKRLNLPECPALVLTTDLLSDSYIILPTDHNRVVEQLEMIGDAMSRFDGRRLTDNEMFMDFLRHIGNPHRARTEDGNSLARNIADLTAVRSLDGQGIDTGARYDRSFIREMASDAQKKDAEKWVNRTLAELRTKLDQARENGGGENVDRTLGRYSDYLSEYCAGKKTAGPAATRQYRIEGDSSYLSAIYEKDTVSAIRSYNHLVPVLLNETDADADEFTHDLSPLCMYLGNIVEEEMNASIVQFLREKKGVPMPEFFRVYDPDPELKSVAVQTRNKRILLNKKHKLIKDNVYSVGTIPIGDTNCVISNMLDNGELYDEIKCFSEQSYFELFKPFGYQRNDAAHPGSMSMQDFEKMHESFRQIVAEYFPAMLELKARMKLGIAQ